MTDLAAAAVFVALLRPRKDREWLWRSSGTHTMLCKRQAGIHGLHAPRVASLNVSYSIIITPRLFGCYLKQ